MTLVSFTIRCRQVEQAVTAVDVLRSCLVTTPTYLAVRIPERDNSKAFARYSALVTRQRSDWILLETSSAGRRVFGAYSYRVSFSREGDRNLGQRTGRN